jgi:hypothetical protein
LQQNPQDPYSSCPYCLTKIELIEIPLKNEEEKKDSLLEAQTKIIDPDLEIKHTKSIEKTVTCKYHLGYLSERASKQQIPDDCLICRDTVECMLMKMRK